MGVPETNEIRVKVERKSDGSVSGEGSVKGPPHLIELTILSIVIVMVAAIVAWLMR